ncbi:RNA polymerase II transcriptional coactivator [Agrilus planipennis]|uniref:RNA polymerase II transcriptional coactivator n=1 Tax=Agrilus planipennis TaxID=224129 RepID=A0A1W4WUX3_AGRPL|nr:RNA polymerase II transcriptional coactivator [Agrilus planipennis]
MPKPSKKKAASSSSSDSDSGPEDRNPPAKKPKTENTSKKQQDDDISWSLGKRRFAKLCEFKGNWYVDIREFYDVGGDLKPGKKGIMLTMEQWQKLKSQIDSIDEAIKRNV